MCNGVGNLFGKNTNNPYFLQKIISFENKIFIVTPPFTQLNTPYPASAYIKGFKHFKCRVSPSSLGIEVILKLFSKAGLQDLFKTAILDDAVSDNSKRIFALQEEYIKTIDPVIRFLQGKIQCSKSAKKIICQSFSFFSTGGTRLGFRYHGNTGQSQAFGDLVPRRYPILLWNV
jgi:hypothetical protein